VLEEQAPSSTTSLLPVRDFPALWNLSAAQTWEVPLLSFSLSLSLSLSLPSFQRVGRLDGSGRVVSRIEMHASRAKWTVARHSRTFANKDLSHRIISCAIYSRDSHKKRLKILGIVSSSFSLDSFFDPLVALGWDRPVPFPLSLPRLTNGRCEIPEIAENDPCDSVPRKLASPARDSADPRGDRSVAVLRSFARIIPAWRSPQARAQLADQNVTVLFK